MLAADPIARGTATAAAARLRELLTGVEDLGAHPTQQDIVDWAVGHPMANPTWVRASDGDAVAQPQMPLLTPAIDMPTPPLMRSRAQVVGAMSGTVLLLGLVVWLGGGGLRHGGAEARTASFTQAKPWPVGLSYTSRASYQAGSGVTLEITLHYRYPITGDLLLVVPAIGADGVTTCADLGPTSWAPPIEAVSLTAAVQRPIACGWRVRDPEAAGTTLRLVVSLAHVASPSTQQLEAWLRQIDTQTQAALATYPASTTPEFALQRLVGLEVTAAREGSAVRYLVQARWLGRVAPPTALLSTTTGCNVVGPLAELFGLPGGAQAPTVTLGALVRHGGPAAQAARGFIAAEGHGLNTQAGPGLVAVDNEAGGTLVATVADLSSPPVTVR